MDALPADLPAPLRRRAEAGAAWVRERLARGEEVLVVHHLDADGLAAGAVAATALERAGVAHRTLCVKSMDDVHVELVRQASAAAADPAGAAGRSAAPGAPALWFCDLGSTVYMRFASTPRLVCDHHQLVRDGTEETFPHVNPLLDGLSGEELSGAGSAYLVAAALDPGNLDLLPLALVGASADLQDRGARAGAPSGTNLAGPGDAQPAGFRGANAALLRHGVGAGLLHAREDLAFFGPHTRPLRKFLALAEPQVPTVSGSQRAAEAFLLACGVPADGPDGERAWADLSADEQRRLRSVLVQRLLDAGLGGRVPMLARTVVTIAREGRGPTRELQEFGTLLNGTGRYGRPDVGLAVARGDRGAAYAEALGLLLDHRKHLAAALDAFASRGVNELQAIQWLHLEDAVLDTVVGIVCGMALDGLGLRRDLALVAFAWTPDGRTKVSSRSPHELQARGIDLAAALREAAAPLGGQGGGHRGAAGATIPRGAEAAFAAHLDRLVAAQLGTGRSEADPRPAPLPSPAPAPVRAPALEVPFLRGRGAQTRLAF